MSQAENSSKSVPLVDITPSMAVYMDPHVLVKTLEFFRNNNIQDPVKMNRYILKILERTNRLKYAKDSFARLKESTAEYTEEEELFLVNNQVALLKLEQQGGPDGNEHHTPEVRQALEAIAAGALKKPEKSERLRKDFMEEENISEEVIESIILYAKSLYDAGEYATGVTVIKSILKLQFTSTEKLLRVSWGGLASAMMAENWEVAMTMAAGVKETIENKQQPRPQPDTFGYIPQIDQLRNRASFLHWALYVFPNFDTVNGMELFVSLCMEKFYLQCIENLCPWMLRYLAAGLILCPMKRQQCLREALNVITALSYRYSDPLTKFLENLFRDFDFDLAQEQLLSFQDVIQKDFFLEKFKDKFTHESRVLICEMYCRIHCKIDLEKLAEKMQMSKEDVELWMVNLVRGGEGGRSEHDGGSSLDAKIDSANGLVIMAPPSKSNYNKVVDKTREISSRSELLASNVRSALEEQAKFIKYRRAIEAPKK